MHKHPIRQTVTLKCKMYYNNLTSAHYPPVPLIPSRAIAVLHVTKTCCLQQLRGAE